MEVCTNAGADANNDGQSMIAKAFWLINQMSQKVLHFQISLFSTDNYSTDNCQFSRDETTTAGTAV